MVMLWIKTRVKLADTTGTSTSPVTQVFFPLSGFKALCMCECRSITFGDSDIKIYYRGTFTLIPALPAKMWVMKTSFIKNYGLKLTHYTLDTSHDKNKRRK